MDPELQRRIEEARRAGYSDQEISAALGQPVPTTTGRPDVAPTVPVLTSEERARIAQEEANERAAQGRTGKAEEPFTFGMGAAALGGAILAWEGGKWVMRRLLSSGAPAAAAPAPVATPAPAPMPAPAPTVAPPPAPPATSPILDAQGRPMVRPAPVTGPVAPAPAAGGMPPLTAGEPPFRPPAQPSVLDRATTMVRQLAANRAVQGAARVGGGFIGGMVIPSNIGQDYPFPQSGPLRGSELNPATGRPWTREELAAYRAQYGR